MIYYLGGKPTFKKRSKISRMNMIQRINSLRKKNSGKTIIYHSNFAVRKDASWLTTTIRDCNDL